MDLLVKLFVWTSVVFILASSFSFFGADAQRLEVSCDMRLLGKAHLRASACSRKGVGV